MSASAADFHRFAERIRAAATEEIDHRNAVSRVYYAAYHACRARFSRPESAINPVAGHSEFCGQLMRESASSPVRRLGFALNFLRQQRNAADYTLDRGFGANDSRTVFAAYENAMRQLDAAIPPAATS